MRKAFSLSIELAHLYDERNFIEKPVGPKPANKINLDQFAQFINPAPRIVDFEPGLDDLNQGIQADGILVRRNLRPAMVDWNDQPFNFEEL